MSRNSRVPSYLLHKATGQAIAVLEGRSFYLGRLGSAASKAEYRRLIAEWLANQQATSSNAGSGEPPPDFAPFRVNELILRYWAYVEGYYRKDGRPTSEQDTIRQALRFVRQSHGHTPAADFGPLALRAVRQAMVDHGMCLGYVNKQVGRVRRMFLWAAANELLPVTVQQLPVRFELRTPCARLARERSPANVPKSLSISVLRRDA